MTKKLKGQVGTLYGYPVFCVDNKGRSIKPVKTVERVCKLALFGKSIYHKRWERRIPAAFIQNMQAVGVCRMVKMGYLYE